MRSTHYVLQVLEWAAASRSQAWASAADEEMAQRIYSDENSGSSRSGNGGSTTSGKGSSPHSSGSGRTDFKSPFPLLPPMAPGMAGSYDGGSSHYDRMKYSTQPLRARPPVQSFARGYMGGTGNNNGVGGGVVVVGSSNGALRGLRSISLPAVCEAEDDEEDGDGADDDGWARAAEGGGIVATGGVGAGVPGTALRLLRLLLAHGADASAPLKLSDEDLDAAFAEGAAAGAVAGGGGGDGDGRCSSNRADVGKEECKGGNGVTTTVSTSARKGHPRGSSRSKVNLQGDTPLHVACRYGLVGAAKDLALVSNLFARSGHEHATPLHLACAQGQVDVISVLLAAADTAAAAAAAAEAAAANAVATAAAETVAAVAETAVVPATAASKVAEAASGGASLAIETGAGGAIIAPNSRASASPVSAARRALCALRTNLPFGETPLHWCARRGHAAALQALVVSGGAALNAPRALDGATPLGVAVLCQQRSAADALVALGASLESPVQWPSPHASSVLPLTSSASSPLPLGAPSEPPLPLSSSSPLPLSVARPQPLLPQPTTITTTTSKAKVKDAQEEGWLPYGRAQGTGARSPGSPPGSPPMLPTSSKLKQQQGGDATFMGGVDSLESFAQPNFMANGGGGGGGDAAPANEFQPIEAGATLADYDRRSGDM